MLHHRAHLVVDQLVPIRDLHAARVLRLHLCRMLVGADQRDVAVCRVAAGVARLLDISEPQAAAEQADDQQGQQGRQHAARAPPGLAITRVGEELGAPVRVDRSEVVAHHYISCTGSTPMTARPEAMTRATARTRARRARVSAGSPARIKRNVASSLPLFHSAWNSAATSWR